MKILVFGIFIVLLTGCQHRQMIWAKPSGTTDEFSKVRYTCLQDAQQQVSKSNYNAYSGTSSSNSKTNQQLFAACMNAEGWYLKQAPEASADDQPVVQSVEKKNKKSKVEPQTTDTPVPSMSIIESKANLRKSPSTKAAIVKVLKKGEEVQVIMQKDDWFQVELASGEVGWCHKSVLSQ